MPHTGVGPRGRERFAERPPSSAERGASSAAGACTSADIVILSTAATDATVCAAAVSTVARTTVACTTTLACAAVGCAPSSMSMRLHQHPKTPVCGE